jgi:hypothetical protein
VFEAFEQNSCIDGSADESFSLQCSSGNIVDSVYNSSATCEGTASAEYPITPECTNVGSTDFDYIASLLSFSSITGTESKGAKVSANNTDDVYPVLTNATYLFDDISIECYYYNTPKPTANPTLAPTSAPTYVPTPSPTTATPTMSPTEPAVYLLVAQVIDNCGYDAFMDDTTSYTQAIVSTIVGSIACIDSSMIAFFTALAPPASSSTNLAIQYQIASSDPSVSISLIESQLDTSLSSGQFTTLLEASATTYNAPDLSDASSTNAAYTDLNASDDDSGSDGLSDAEIGGIVAGVVIFVLIVAGLAYFFYFKPKASSSGTLATPLSGPSTGSTVNPMSDGSKYAPPQVSTAPVGSSSINNSTFGNTDTGTTRNPIA